MAALKPAYLIHGDDHGGIAERRARLRALAEGGADGGAAVEVLEGDAATPAGVANALAAMTLTLSSRVIIVEGVERWREADVEKQLAPALGAIPEGTTVALFAREEARVKAPDALAKAVLTAGGQLVSHRTVKRKVLPAWVREQASHLGIELDSAASEALIAHVGERPQRLLRELEKLALEAEPREAITAEDVELAAARSAERRVYAFVDELVAGEQARATATFLGVRQQGESVSGLVYLMARRMREALEVALRLEAGEPPAQIKRTLRMPSRAADRFIKDVSRTDPERLRSALTAIADLELDSRGGALLTRRRSSLAALDKDTIALRAIAAITA
jgi:DNA polymerase-3 subunit delta